MRKSNWIISLRGRVKKENNVSKPPRKALTLNGFIMLHWFSQTISSFKTAKAPKSISPRYSRFASRNPQQGPGLWGFLFVRFLSWNTSPSLSLQVPGWAHGSPPKHFSRWFGLLHPLKKNTDLKKGATKRSSDKSPSPRTTVVHGCHVSLPSANDEKTRLVQLGIPAFSSWIHFQCWPSTLDGHHAGTTSCNPLN